MPRRDRGAQHVGQGARVPVGDGPRERQHLGREHRVGRHDPLQPGQRTLGVRARRPGDDPPVDLLAGEADAHPYAGLRGKTHRRGHGVVEGAVQVRQRDVHHDLGHRVGLGQPFRGLGTGAAYLLLQQGELLPPRLRGHPGVLPDATVIAHRASTPRSRRHCPERRLSGP